MARLAALATLLLLGVGVALAAVTPGPLVRLAFAIATTFEPEILLMDEWIGAGDPAFQEKARGRMATLTEQAGIIVLASHNHALLRRTCNRFLELEAGRVKCLSRDPDEVMRPG